MNESSISADFPYEPHYLEVKGSRIHYIDQGSGPPVLLLHGNPTSSYLWRNIIPHLADDNRCLAPDLIGMGKSDKPDIEYRFFDHYGYLEDFITETGLEDLVLVIHDWGSALGFYYAMRHEDNVRGIAFMEAIIMPLRSWDEWPETGRRIFQGFRTPEVGWDMIVNRNFFIERILPSSVSRPLTEAEMDHYRAPYLEPESRKPIWRWPNEIPIEGEPADVMEAVEEYNRWLRQTRIPKLLLYAHPGFLIGEEMLDWCRDNLENLKTVDVGEGVHFIQEDKPHLIGGQLAEWIKSI